MGQSADADLFWGYCWDDESVELFEGYDSLEWDEVLVRSRGWVSPFDAIPSYLNQWDRKVHATYEQYQRESEAWIAERRAELDAFYASMKAVREEYGCDVRSYGSNDYGVPYIYVKGTLKSADWGGPVSIDLQALDAQVDHLNALGKLEMFVEALNIDTSEAKGPGWFLVASFG